MTDDELKEMMDWADKDGDGVQTAINSFDKPRGDKQYSKRRRSMVSIHGSPLFMAPEIIHGSGYGPEVDFWSFGVMLYVGNCARVTSFPEITGNLLSIWFILSALMLKLFPNLFTPLN